MARKLSLDDVFLVRKLGIGELVVGLSELETGVARREESHVKSEPSEPERFVTSDSESASFSVVLSWPFCLCSGISKPVVTLGEEP